MRSKRKRVDHASDPRTCDMVLTEDPPAERQEAMSERVQALRLDKAEMFQRRKPRRRLRWLLLVLLLSAGTAAYVHRDRLRGPLQERLEQFRPVPEITAVTASMESPVEVVLNTTGYVISHTVVRVSSLVPGTIVEANFEEGDIVDKGQILARLDDRQYLADLSQSKALLAGAEARLAELRHGSREEDVLKARAAMEQAKAHRDLMNEELARAEKLKGTISQTEYDRAKSHAAEGRAAFDQATLALRLVEVGARKEQIDAAAAEVQSAHALVEKAQYFYDNTKIVSLIRGKVIERTAEVGETLRLETVLTSLYRLADFSRLEVEIDIPERDLAEIRLKQPCRVITEAYPGREYKGRLDWLAPIFNRQRAIRGAKITILDPDEKLAPDMNCQVQVLAQERPEGKRDVLRLPVAAIQEQAGKAFLYVVQNDTARRRQVKVEKAANGKVEVLEGLASGEVVLLPGKTTVRDGQSVRVRMVPSEGSG